MDDIDIIGIDLGTTNSIIAIWDIATKQPRVLPNSECKQLTPSVVITTARV
jgi:molecular chaperone DnaK